MVLVENVASHSPDYFERQILHRLDIRVRLYHKNNPIIHPWWGDDPPVLREEPTNTKNPLSARPGKGQAAVYLTGGPSREHSLPSHREYWLQILIEFLNFDIDTFGKLIDMARTLRIC